MFSVEFKEKVLEILETFGDETHGVSSRFLGDKLSDLYGLLCPNFKPDMFAAVGTACALTCGYVQRPGPNGGLVPAVKTITEAEAHSSIEQE